MRGSDETIRRAVLNKTGIALLGENMIKEELAEGILLLCMTVKNQLKHL